MLNESLACFWSKVVCSPESDNDLLDKKEILGGFLVVLSLVRDYRQCLHQLLAEISDVCA
jgi:hypothetical protein